MKYICVAVGFAVGFGLGFFAVEAQASTNKDGRTLVPALETVFETKVDIPDNLLAWSADFDSESDSIIVKTLSMEGVIDTYGCSAADCEKTVSEKTGVAVEELPDGVNFDYIYQAYTKSIDKLKRSLARKNVTLESIREIKTWVDLESKSDHGDGADVWTNIVHTLNDRIMNIYIYCHLHGDEGYFCHYAKDGRNELPL